MQFFQLTTLVAVLAAVSEACKCVRGGEDVGHTQICCQQTGGTFASNDCQAHSISNKLSNFYKCCQSYGDTSDCDCSKGCAVVEKRDVDNLKVITTAGAILTLI